ncbi:MAG: Maf family protein [bacterium]
MEIIKQLFAKQPLVLASGSPRRQELFRSLGLNFSVHVPAVEEQITPGLPPEKIVIDLAKCKARHAAKSFSDACVVSADTIVVLEDQVLGKPKDVNEAEKMLLNLSGNTHEVFTGYAIVTTPQNEIATGFERTAVTFHDMDTEEIKAYVATKSPLDKAGAYGIQDAGAIFVRRIEGCFYNVMGFPIASFYQTCRAFLKK